MKYIKTYKIFESKQWYDDLLDKMKSKFHQFISNMGKEKDETKEAFKLIAQSAKGEKDLTDAEKKQIGDQMKDVLKTVGLTAASVLPGGTIYFLIIKLLKLEKFTLPSSFLTEGVVLNEKSSVVLNNIEDIFREIEDTGFEIEYVRGDDNPTSSGIHFLNNQILKIFIEKFDVYGFSDEPRHVTYMITKEIIDSLLHLVSYVKESNLDYKIDIMLNQSYRRSISILTESEIENMINWKDPIDYIKIVISNKD
jgi:uncharacterized protein (UPF0335 family)